MGSKRGGRATTWVLTGLAIAGCSAKVPEAWISERAAVIRCTSAGKERMPPVLVDQWGPSVPTGLYARAMDPLALSELGFQRDALACATFEAPTEAEIEDVRTSVAALSETYEDASREAIRAAGRCTCDTAEGLGLRDLIASCSERSTREDCEAGYREAELRTALAPLLAALEQTRLPLLHWRLAGETDREGWFLENLSELLSRHEGGSTVYRVGEAVPARGNFELIRGLLEEDDVVAVVRQDAGTALLVVREKGDMLVLDHFSYPAVSNRNRPLLAFLDNANLSEYVDRLKAPSSTRKPDLDPTRGNLVEVDRALLEEVDRMIAFGLPLAGATYDPSAEKREGPDPMIDRVTVLAPFGNDGEVLVARLKLSGAGTQWAQTLTDAISTPTLEELSLSGEGPSFVAGAPIEVPFVLRGTTTESFLFLGLHRFADWMARVEMNHPSTIQGNSVEWSFELPTADLALGRPDAPLPRLREQLAGSPYRAEAHFEPARDVMRVELRPR